jgi:hypothetical protein
MFQRLPLLPSSGADAKLIVLMIDFWTYPISRTTNNVHKVSSCVNTMTFDGVIIDGVWIGGWIY